MPAHMARLGKVGIAGPTKPQQPSVARLQWGTIALSPTHLPLSPPAPSSRSSGPGMRFGHFRFSFAFALVRLLWRVSSGSEQCGARTGEREAGGESVWRLGLSAHSLAPMGKQIPDVCGPLSPKAKLQADKKEAASCYAGKKLRLWCAALVAVPCVLFLVTLSLYLLLCYSDPVKQLKGCEVELQNRTAQMGARLGSLEKRVDESEGDLQKARAERDGLRAGLEVANRTLEKTREDWVSCREQLESVEKNATAQVKEAVQREMEKNKAAEEEIKQLKEQLSDLQQTKEQQQKAIQHLEEQLREQNPIERSKEDLLERSKGDLLLGPSMVLLSLLSLLLAGFLP